MFAVLFLLKHLNLPLKVANRAGRFGQQTVKARHATTAPLKRVRYVQGLGVGRVSWFMAGSHKAFSFRSLTPAVGHWFRARTGTATTIPTQFSDVAFGHLP